MKLINNLSAVRALGDQKVKSNLKLRCFGTLAGVGVLHEELVTLNIGGFCPNVAPADIAQNAIQTLSDSVGSYQILSDSVTSH